MTGRRMFVVHHAGTVFTSRCRYVMDLAVPET